MAEVWLFCEGPSDEDILGRIFDRVLGAGITVAAVGGGHMGPAAEFWRRRHRERGVTWPS